MTRFQKYVGNSATPFYINLPDTGHQKEYENHILEQREDVGLTGDWRKFLYVGFSGDNILVYAKNSISNEWVLFFELKPAN